MWQGAKAQLCSLPACIHIVTGKSGLTQGSLNRQAKAGLYKNKLYNLITAILQSATPAETTQFLQKHSFLWEKYFASIKDANYEKTKIYNKNESSAFDVALIKHLSSKDATAI